MSRNKAYGFFFAKASLQEIEEWIDQGGDVNSTCINSDWSPLFVAADHNRLQIAKLLLERGADVNAQTEYKYTALYFASYYGRCEMVQLLLEHGADPSIRSCRGKSAEDAANTDAIRELLSKHAASQEEQNNVDSNHDENSSAVNTPEPTPCEDYSLKKRMKLAQAKYDYECTVAEMELEIKTTDMEAKTVKLKGEVEIQTMHAMLALEIASLKSKREAAIQKLRAKMELQVANLETKSESLQAKSVAYKRDTEKVVRDLAAKEADGSKEDLGEDCTN